MRKIIIRNKGLLTAEDIMYIGNSSKRGDDTKIGEFGSGWKYALAWLLRNDCNPQIWSGLNKLPVETQMIVTARNRFSAIIIDGKDTSLTVEMGPKWTGWMALREIISNAIDEAEYQLEIGYSDPVPKEGYTTVCIPANGELMEVIDHFENYFAFNRKESYQNSRGRVFVKANPSPIKIYRKGICCYNTTIQSILDFDFSNIYISEDRLTEGSYIESEAKELLRNCDDYNVLKTSLLSNRLSFLPNHITKDYMSCITQMKNEGYNFCYAGFPIRKSDDIEIPRAWFTSLVELGIFQDPISDLFKSLDHKFYPENGFDVEEAELKYYISVFHKNCEVYIGKIDAGYMNVSNFSKENRYFFDSRYIKTKPMKELAAEGILSNRDHLLIHFQKMM